MKTLTNRRGQVAIEAVLLTAVLVIVSVALINLIRQNGIFTKMVTGPWKKVAGMTEYGTWDDPNGAAKTHHPINNERAYSKK